MEESKNGVIERWFYGKLAVFDISESGRAIGEKLVLP